MPSELFVCLQLSLHCRLCFCIVHAKTDGHQQSDLDLGSQRAVVGGSLVL